MKRISNYLHYAFRSIQSDKLYSTFYVLGMTVAFVLIILLLSAVRLVSSSRRPFVNAANTVNVKQEFNDEYGSYLDPLLKPGNLDSFLESVPGAEGYAISNRQNTIAYANGKVRSAAVDFVNSRYFGINSFHFISGRPFADDDAREAVVTESFADRSFRVDPVGETVTIQRNEYRIVGVVEDFSPLQNPNERAVIWVPYTFDKFVPSGDYFDVDIVFDRGMGTEEMKENLCHALKQHYAQFRYNNGESVRLRLNPGELQTVQEAKLDFVGGSAFGYGAAAILLLLLLIPALNIMSLSSAKIQASSREMAIRRALGATQMQTFWQILSENLILSVAGYAAAALLAGPALEAIDALLMTDNGTTSMLSGFSSGFGVHAVSFLLALVFAVISGGIPAWRLSRRNIAAELKGRDI